ncbi:phosphoacetylglucosamine mutase [Biomphalaria pfeifferi]|uniref:Phosphoacetylglucosamine mutase n=1 Tax=Biomphalaria pfeifferi TaxID=112525 RepID=A0AAD8BIQ6_BIOPF|nr:phosphoacetylglucosamine mutase [Biomphalaria pfeifferi]
MDIFEKAAEVGIKKHPRNLKEEVTYGTAGFRMRADSLDHIVYRMGLLSVMFSKFRSGVTGLMITASHNPEEDNGVKLIDLMGEMMPIAWEKYATSLANVSDDKLVDVLQEIAKLECIDVTKPATVSIGRDTRASSLSLSEAAVDGIEAMKGKCSDFGLLTTPQLHYIVCCQNTGGQYGEPTEEGYYKKLSAAFLTLNKNRKVINYVPELYLDLANGVGAPKLQQLCAYLGDVLNINVCNNGSGKLNYQCGADFVKVSQMQPVGLNLEPGMRCASFDGDGDRLVYYYKTCEGKFALLDGDKIATLFAAYLNDLLKSSQLKLNMGLVQTAYANGSSTNYINDVMKIPVACVPTGVKYLHHKAQDFDIGVYFEANGHGTVLFSRTAQKLIRNQASDNSLDEVTRDAAVRLATIMDLINQTVGDAISDMLVVETILASKDWTCEDWDSAYTDLPSRQIKIKVENRLLVETTDAERRTTKPAGLQEAIDEVVAGYKHGRAFARPSGTEDVVRVYAEADTQANADKLACEVGLRVYNLARGIGEKPSV